MGLCSFRNAFRRKDIPTAAPEQNALSAEDFLHWIERQSDRHELVAGVPVRWMAGARESHNLFTTNLVAALVPSAKKSGCKTASSDMAVRTGPFGVRFPDVVIDCGPPDPNAKAASRPILVIEVASPATSAIDVTDKLDEYRSHRDIQVIMLIDPEMVSVKLDRRDEGVGWQIERYAGLDAVIDVPEIGATLAVSDIYDTLTPKTRPAFAIVGNDEPTDA